MTEIQAVVPGPATGTHASPELEPGPRTRGDLWRSELPFDEETRKPDGFQNLLVQNGQLNLIDDPSHPN